MHSNQLFLSANEVGYVFMERTSPLRVLDVNYLNEFIRLKLKVGDKLFN